MWPWTRIAALTARAAILEHSLDERDRRYEMLRHDYDVLRADYGQLVAQLGNLAIRPVGQTLMDKDLFAEDTSLPDEWLSPTEGEPIATDQLEELLSGDDRASE